MTVVNLAYKHLDAKLRIADLTVGQWLGVFAGGVIAVVYGSYVHPFGTMLNLVSAVYLGGLPAAVALLAGLSDFDLPLLLRSAVEWRNADGRYLAGPGTPTPGYRVLETQATSDYAGNGLAQLDLEQLWGDS